MAPVGPDGEAPSFPTWGTGRLVRVHPGNPRHYELMPESDTLPEDNCFVLVE